MPDIRVTEKGVLKLLLKSCWSRRYKKGISTELHQQSLPDIWKHANVNPIYKKGDKTNPSNYLSMSLTCISCKLLEHIICSSLMQHLTKHNILYPLQNGFREKRSCETQLIEGVQNDVEVMDFAKAFDKVAHNRLLYKLTSNGIKGNT